MSVMQINSLYSLGLLALLVIIVLMKFEIDFQIKMRKLAEKCDDQAEQRNRAAIKECKRCIKICDEFIDKNERERISYQYKRMLEILEGRND